MSRIDEQSRITPSDLLGHMQVPGYKRTFVLGSYERRVTVYSQQVRALNLIYALFHERQLTPGQRVAVIGGGVAGLTAAAGALRKGCKVTVLEKNERILHMFENCTKRWLHPRVYDWPLPGSLDGDAALPLLTWRAALAGEVVDQIATQWRDIKRESGDRARVLTEISDVALEVAGDDLRVSWNPHEIGRFDVVILAVGFGIERDFPAATSSSYWDDGPLDGSDRNDGEVSILISGLGDGGLTDLVSACLQGYRHDELVTRFALDPDQNPAARTLADHLLELEREAARRERSGNPEAAAEHLSKEYGAPLDPLAKFVDDQLIADVRSRRQVFLNGEGQLPITRGASILNRFLAARLLRHDLVRYLGGTLTLPKDEGQCGVIIGDRDPKSFHKIIARHGTESALDKGFRTLHKDAEPIFRARNDLDQTRRERMWEREPGWYGAAPSSPRPPDDAPTPDTPSPDLTTSPASDSGAQYTPTNRAFKLPFQPRRDRLIGRADALTQVRTQLVSGHPTAIGQAAAFQGLGGLGKTQLAVDYAHLHSDDYPSGVIWLEADRDLDAQLIEQAVSARWIAPMSEHEHKLAVALQRLRTFAGGLVIFDNVEARADIDDYLPQPDAGAHILITSRGEHDGFWPIGLSQLDVDQSVALLEQTSGRALTDAAARDEARAISKLLDGLPLAVELAGVYLRRRPSMTWRAYREMLDASLRDAIPTGYSRDTLTQHEANLFAALRVSERLLDEYPRLRRILDVLTWSGTASMGTPLLAALLGEAPALLTGDLGYGVALGLLQLDVPEDADAPPAAPRHRIHRLVREVRRQEPAGLEDPEQGHSWARRVCTDLGEWFEKRREDFADLASFEAELDHLRTWRDIAVENALPEGVRLTWLLGYPAYHHGRYREAKERVQDAFTSYGRIGLDDPTLAAHLHNDLGETYGELGDHNKALEYHQQALQLRQGVLGEQHPDTATSLNNIGSTYHALGDHKKALEYYQQALELRRRVLGEHPPHTAKALGNIGTTYRALGDHNKALEYHQQALQLLRRILGEQHPDAATSLSNIGATYLDLGEYHRARDYLEQAWSIFCRVFGDHDYRSLNTLVGLVQCMGRTKQQHQACELLDKTLRTLPKEHPRHVELRQLRQQWNPRGFRQPGKPGAGKPTKKRPKKSRRKGGKPKRR
ncbi:FAD-dependent oxidoreductase [Haliangium sp.]|uniref:FAD-dependent oxidoreductase n=1 Tax=Haliangium sp. TaxID=2663208 RepID=UPI003D13B8D6